jgi:peptidoglycan/LPS O-acetylase OafA/YrhL
MTPRARIDALDSLRGIAIVLVMLFHFTMQGRTGGHAPSLAMAIAGSAWCGVDLFFALSGFLITGILLDERDAPRSLRNFYVRRGLRILPLYYAVLALVLVVGPRVAPAGAPALATISEHQGWLWSHCANLFIATHGWSVFKSGWVCLNHFWSLSVEEHFYLFWPLIVRRASRRRLALICLALALAAPLVRIALFAASGATAAYTLTPCRMDALAVGALFAVLSRGAGGIAACVPLARRMAIVCGSLLALLFAWRGGWSLDDGVVDTAGLSLLASFAAAIVVLSAGGARGARLLAHPLLRALGKYSYGIYVFHQLLQPMFERLFPAARLGLTAHVLVAMTLSVAAARLSWTLLEKHALGLKRYFVAASYAKSDENT